MRRASLFLALALAACQQQSVSPSAQLSGIRDMLRVGNFIFATSTERDELRVLQLDTGDTGVPRKYVRAPNPIQALSIPVLKQPTALATDVFFQTPPGPGAAGTEVAGPYVYAWSNGSAQISIVWGENTDASRGFTELARLTTTSPVTAVASQASPPDSTGMPVPGTLYFSTFDGTTATLFRLPMKTTAALLAIPADDRATALQTDVRVVLTLQDELFIDFVTLPNNELAITTRGIKGKAGRAVVIDGSNGNIRVALQFPSAVRALYTHAAFDLRGLAIGAGARVYGVLDELSCGNASCGGIVAVDTDTGLRSLSWPGRQLEGSRPRDQLVAPPITFGSGLLQSVGLTPGGSVALPPAAVVGAIDYSERVLGVLGVATLSNGQIGFFAAAELQHINTSSTGPTYSTTLPDGGVTTVPDDGGVPEGPVLTLANGGARDEVVIVVGNGVVQDLGALTPQGDFLPTALTDRARVGDTIDNCSEADGGIVTVTAIEPTGVRLSTSCTNTVAVRAGATDPYVVVGTLDSYMGRSGPMQTLGFHGSYAFHTDGFDPSRDAVTIAFPAEPALQREERFTIAVDDGFLPTVLLLTTTGCNAGTTTLPGAVLDDPTTDRQRIYVAYPSANAIVELRPDAIRRTGALDTGLLCWR